MSVDEWLIQQVISCNLLSREQLETIKEIKNTTGDTYEKILIDRSFMLPQQIQQMKSQYQRAQNTPSTSSTMVSNAPIPATVKYRTIKKTRRR